jgi:hypothetical protein
LGAYAPGLAVEVQEKDRLLDEAITNKANAPAVLGADMGEAKGTTSLSP